MWEYKAGTIGEEEMREVEDCGFYNTCGACGVMGTANSVQSMAEAMGLTLPGCASIPAVYAQRIHMAEATGIKIMELVEHDIRPSDILTRAAFENAIKVLMATGASTNLIIHLIAIARRAGVDLTLDDFDRISNETPFITNVKPSGACTVEELYHAGGIHGGDETAGAPAGHLGDDRQRQDAGRESQERADRRPLDHPPARRSDPARRAGCASCAATWPPMAR